MNSVSIVRFCILESSLHFFLITFLSREIEHLLTYAYFIIIIIIIIIIATSALQLQFIQHLINKQYSNTTLYRRITLFPS